MVWQIFLIKYNIFTFEKDTVPLKCINSNNYVRNLHLKNENLFFTIIYNNENKTSWVKYDISTGKQQIIKEDFNNQHSKILTFHFIPNINSILYVMDSYNNDIVEFNLYSILNGKEEIISSTKIQGDIVSSAFNDSILYFLERIDYSDSTNNYEYSYSLFVINSLNIINKKITRIYTFPKGIEASNISIYSDSKLLISVQKNINLNDLRENIELNNSDIELNVNASSYLYIIDLLL